MADYSFILLSQMVSGNKGSWSATELSQKTSLPLPTVAKLMKQMARGGIVVGTRGASGGYSLASPAEKIPVSKIIEAIDGPIALTDCVDGNESCCAAECSCPMYGGWEKINKAVRKALGEVFLSDLVAECRCRKAV